MATGTQQQQNGKNAQPAAAPKKLEDMTREELLAVTLDNTKMEAKFIPFGEKEPIKLTRGNIKTMLANPTKNGNWPTTRDIDNFIMLCKARALNPFVGDAFLVGYDSRNDGPKFSLITAHQALLKRAELHDQYDGMKGGIIVTDKDGNVTKRASAFKHPGDELIGAWAIVYRKDRTYPTEVELEVGSRRGQSPLWDKDPCGMLVKCAKSHGLREAFPNTLAGLYSQEEFDIMQHQVADEQAAEIRSISARLAAKRAESAQQGNDDADDYQEKQAPEEASNETTTIPEEEMRPEILAFVELCGETDDYEKIKEADEQLTCLTEVEEKLIEEAKNKAAAGINKGKGGKTKQGTLA